ncbi:hypothetical protein RIF29_22442 [Crotalaria pallida]|uniref:Uncharacterized protein n=1 Tax=Crotalaria pallida TaxID=3830 RepID=A0AAN9I6V6_CROPI
MGRGNMVNIAQQVLGKCTLLERIILLSGLSIKVSVPLFYFISVYVLLLLLLLFLKTKNKKKNPRAAAIQNFDSQRL